MGSCTRSAAPIPGVSTRNLVPGQARRSITPPSAHSRVRGTPARSERAPHAGSPGAARHQRVRRGVVSAGVGDPHRAIGCEQRRDAVVVAHHRRIGELAAQRLDLDAVSYGLKGRSSVSSHGRPRAAGGLAARQWRRTRRPAGLSSRFLPVSGHPEIQARRPLAEAGQDAQSSHSAKVGPVRMAPGPGSRAPFSLSSRSGSAGSLTPSISGG